MSKFDEVLAEAVQDFTVEGYDSYHRLDKWMILLRQAAIESLLPLAELDRYIAQSLEARLGRAMTKRAMARRHPNVAPWTIARLKPHMREELSRRIVASAQLIRLNRDEAIEKALRHFSGWASSVPVGGSEAVNRHEVKAGIKKSLKQLSFQERRVAIDQGFKLISSIDQIIAHEGGAIAGKWRDHGSVDHRYHARKEHMARDDKFYAIRGNWALEKGYMTKCDGYTDDQTQPGEEVYCRCFYVYIYNLRDLPPEFITKKGKQAMAEAKAGISA